LKKEEKKMPRIKRTVKEIEIELKKLSKIAALIRFVDSEKVSSANEPRVRRIAADISDSTWGVWFVIAKRIGEVDSKKFVKNVNAAYEKTRRRTTHLC
jgi:hypothetical protein